jgi:formate dehydrogenase subunit gamma
VDKNASKTGRAPNPVSNSPKIADNRKTKPGGLPKFYYPLIFGILIVEAVILVLCLWDIIPLPFKGGLEIYETAGYFSYILPSDTSRLAVIITRWFFFALTAGVMIPVTIIIIAEIVRRWINSRRVENKYAHDDEFFFLEPLEKIPKNPHLSKDRIQGNFVKRFDRHQRAQHYMLFSSFIVLFITGMLRGFPHWPTFDFFTRILGGPDLLKIVHDIAAFVMIICCIYHIVYIAYGYFVKHKSPINMIPNTKDLKDMIHTMLWIVGIYQKEPQYAHFQYGQKIDYWAIFWGMPVMVITGIVMMFPQWFTGWFDGQWYAVLVTAHRDEAVLATSFIIIVHMYYGHLAAPAFPVNTTMFTGRMPKDKYKEWYGREYSELTGGNNNGKKE